MCRELYISRALSHHIFWHKSHRKNPVTCRRPTAGVRRVLKGRVLLTETPIPHPPRLQTSWERQYRCPAHEKHLHQTVSVPHSPTHPLPLTSHLRLLGLSGTQSGLTKHRLLILSAVRASAAVSQWPDVGWSAQQQGTADVFYNTSWRKETAFWGILGFFFVVGWRPIFFLPGRELPVFL